MLAVLKHHINVLCVVEVSVQLHDVWVVESPLDFEFTLHLGEEVELFEHVFEDDFESARYASITLHSFEYFAEFSTADCLDT